MSKQLHEMSDEELLALDPSTLVEEQPPADEATTEEGESQAAPEQTEQPTDDVFEQETVNPTEDITPEVSQEPANEEPAEPQTEPEESTDVDYQSFYAAVTAPFKANGKEIQITDPSDVISLMQQGANYSKKMQEIKPHQAVIKTLEQNGLLDSEKLGYLIDLKNKKPEAIAKLLNDSEIDLYSFDTEQAKDYVPTQAIVPITPFEDTINSLSQDNPVFSEVLDSIINVWDDSAKEIVYGKPEILNIMNEHAKTGLFSQINNAIERERLVGRLTNVNYLQAYSIMEERFANVAKANTQSQPQPFTAPRPTQAKPSNPNNNNNKNKAAMPSASGNNNNNNNINPLAMSDEELLQYMSTLT